MRFAKLPKLTICVVVGLWPVVGTAQLPQAQTTATSPTSVDGTISDIVKARSYTTEFVNIAKDTFKSDSKEYLQAHKLYASAFANYSAWDAYVASAIRNGNSKKINTDPKYKKVTTDATESANTFTDYVNKNTGQDKAITTVISALADLGIELWIKWSNKAQADRAAAATAFETATKWQNWDEIGGASEKQPTKSTPKPAAPGSK
jgi:hypothetical protein